MLRLDSYYVFFDLYNAAFAEKLFQLELMDSASSVDKMIGSIDVSRRVKPETDLGNICLASVCYRLADIDLYLRVALINRNVLTDWDRNVIDLHFNRIVQTLNSDNIWQSEKHLLQIEI